MKIRLLAATAGARGAFRKGDVVDWPAKDATPLIDCGAAEVFVEEAKKPKPAKEG